MLRLTKLLGQRYLYSDMNMNFVAVKTQGANQENNGFETSDVTLVQKLVLNW